MGKWQAFQIFLKILTPFFISFSQIKVFFFRKISPGSLDHTFLHNPWEFKQNRSSGTREMLTTVYKR